MHVLPVVLTIDKDIPMDGKTASLYAYYQAQLKSMDTGDSFFLRNTFSKQIQPLLLYAQRLGIDLNAIDTDEDEVYLAPGVRVWRLDKPLSSDKPDKSSDKPDKSSDKPDKSSDKHLTAPDKLPDKLPDKPDKSPDKHLTAPDKPGTRYWHHLTSGLTFSTANNIWPPDNPNVVEVDQATHERIKAEHAPQPTWWRTRNGVAEEWLPGKYPPPEQNMTPITKAEYDELKASPHKIKPAPIWIGGGGVTWWRRANGTCVEVPADKLEKAKATPGAVQIHSDDFLAWRESQEETL